MTDLIIKHICTICTVDYVKFGNISHHKLVVIIEQGGCLMKKFIV